MFQQILIAHDGSDSARKAFDTAVHLTSQLGSHLRMICIEEEIPRHAEVIDELREEQDRADSYFGQLAAHCRSRAAMQGVELETTILPGHAVRVIGDYIRQNAIDLLVIGFTGHSRVYEHIWGGTAHNLTSTVACSVLVVK
jgi:nucleotide-binding universal stress UspA family protein